MGGGTALNWGVADVKAKEGTELPNDMGARARGKGHRGNQGAHKGPKAGPCRPESNTSGIADN